MLLTVRGTSQGLGTSSISKRAPLVSAISRCADPTQFASVQLPFPRTAISGRPRRINQRRRCDARGGPGTAAFNPVALLVLEVVGLHASPLWSLVKPFDMTALLW